MDVLVSFLWFQFVWLLFAYFKPNKALILSLLLGQLFLPIIAFKPVEGFLLIYKQTLIGMPLAIIAPLKLADKISEWKPRWVDLPMAVWCIVPFFTSISNDLGAPDGLTNVVNRILEWGLPYFLGRVAIDDLEGLQLVEKYLFIGGLIYVPLCLYEMRVTPVLHSMVYGRHQAAHTYAQSFRMGGYRPTVFMQHGLAVGLWMMATSLSAITHLLLQSKDYKLSKFFLMSSFALIATFALCKSTGAYVIFSLTVISMVLGIKYGSTTILKILTFLPLLFVTLRSSRLWLGENLIQFGRDFFGGERAESLAFRISNENLLTLHVWLRPILGWGGFNRAEVINPVINKPIVFDSLWGVSFGVNGYVGLISITLAIVLPIALCLKRYPPQTWKYPANSGIVTMLFVTSAYSLDNLFNNMPNQYILFGIGALANQLYRAAKTKDELITFNV